MFDTRGGFVFVRQTPKTAALIQREGDHWIRPCENALVTSDNARQMLAEAERALRHCLEDATFAWAYKANALWRLGRDAEAREAARMVPAQLVIE